MSVPLVLNLRPAMCVAAVCWGSWRGVPATGPGHVAAAAAARGAELVGVDITEGCWPWRGAITRSSTFRHADAEALPFADSWLGAVVRTFVLKHLPRPKVTAAELARVLEGGLGDAADSCRAARLFNESRGSRLVDSVGGA